MDERENWMLNTVCLGSCPVRRYDMTHNYPQTTPFSTFASASNLASYQVLATDDRQP